LEKYDRARKATGDNIMRRMRFVCWITEAADTHSEYLILIALAMVMPTRLIVTKNLCNVTVT